jgi:hypothetical protein
MGRAAFYRVNARPREWGKTCLSAGCSDCGTRAVGGGADLLASAKARGPAISVRFCYKNQPRAGECSRRMRLFAKRNLQTNPARSRECRRLKTDLRSDMDSNPRVRLFRPKTANFLYFLFSAGEPIAVSGGRQTVRLRRGSATYRRRARRADEATREPRWSRWKARHRRASLIVALRCVPHPASRVSVTLPIRRICFFYGAQYYSPTFRWV